MISVIIPTHQRDRDLAHLLLALSKQSISSEQFEVLVVGNLPHAPTQQTIQTWQRVLPQLQYFETGRLGVNRARNLGMDHAKGEILVFLDDDCVPNTRYLEIVAALHKEFPEYTGIGGFYISPAETSRWSLAYNQISKYWLSSSRIAEAETTNLVGGNATYKAAAVRGKFRFAENIIFGGAETEFNARLLGAGLRLAIFSLLNLEHTVQLNARDFIRRAWVQGQSARLLRRRGEVPQFRTYATPLREVPLTVKLFQIIFRIAGDYAEISLYEDNEKQRRKILIRQYWHNFRLSWRNSIFLREFGCLVAYYWQKPRRPQNPTSESR